MIPSIESDVDVPLAQTESLLVLTCVRNRGDLAEGWYDSSTKHKADQSAPAPLAHATISARQASQAQTLPAPALDGSNSEPEDDYGPSLPDQHVQSSRGPAVPRLEDLQHRNGIWRFQTQGLGHKLMKPRTCTRRRRCASRRYPICAKAGAKATERPSRRACPSCGTWYT